VVSIGAERTALADDPYVMRLQDFFAQFMRPRRTVQEYSALGSGIVIDEAGLVLTNWHVVRAADGRLQVNLKDGVKCEAALIGFDVNSDLCLLRIISKEEGRHFEVASFARADDLLLGETVLALGNPYGLEHSVSQGLLSAFNRSLGEGSEYNDMLQTDAAINPGNSGGPLLNLEGDVIGINQAMRGNAQGIGFAIPVKRIESFLCQWLRPETFSGCTLGFSIAEDADGVYVIDAKEGSSLKNGDRIRVLDGKAISRKLDFCRASWKLTTDEKVQILLDDGRKMELAPARLGDRELVGRRLDLGLQRLTPALCKALDIPDDTQGLVISDLFPEGEYRTEEQQWREGVGRGDILLAADGKRLNSFSDLADIVRGRRGGEVLLAEFAALDMSRRYVRYRARLILK
jgi:S1-C subfamily serine protease